MNRRTLLWLWLMRRLLPSQRRPNVRTIFAFKSIGERWLFYYLIANFVISAVLASAKNSTNACGRFQFQCHSGECIAVYNACDSIPQCEDGSDEGPEVIIFHFFFLFFSNAIAMNFILFTCSMNRPMGAFLYIVSIVRPTHWVTVGQSDRGTSENLQYKWSEGCERIAAEPVGVHES